MEKIVWVTTPKCSVCRPAPDFARRRGCMGCSRLREPPAAGRDKTEQGKPAAGAPAEAAKKKKVPACEILRLRAAGMSYGAIAGTFGIPRSTVQSVVTRASNRAPVSAAPAG